VLCRSRVSAVKLFHKSNGFSAGEGVEELRVKAESEQTLMCSLIGV
jgi:hypothetical protein